MKKEDVTLYIVALFLGVLMGPAISGLLAWQTPGNLGARPEASSNEHGHEAPVMAASETARRR